MGDVVMISPLLRCTYQQLAEAEIHVLTQPEFTELIPSQYVSKVHTYERGEYSYRDSPYDYIIDLQNSRKSRRLCYGLSGKLIKTDKAPIRKWLYLLARVNRLGVKTVIDRHFESVSELNIEYDGLGLSLPATSLESSNRDRKKIALVLGGTYITKRIPSSIAHSLIKSYPDYKWILLGGNDVQSEASKYDDYPNVENHIGATTIKASIKLVTSSALVVTGDTGMMHIAAALRKPTVVIWGSTSSDFGFAPLYPDDMMNPSISVEHHERSCRPCSKYGRSKCPKGHMNCLNQISINDIKMAIDTHLQKN